MRVSHTHTHSNRPVCILCKEMDYHWGRSESIATLEPDHTTNPVGCLFPKGMGMHSIQVCVKVGPPSILASQPHSLRFPTSSLQNVLVSDLIQNGWGLFLLPYTHSTQTFAEFILQNECSLGMTTEVRRGCQSMQP